MFFSVISPIKMFGKVFIPCICYKATKEMELTVEKLAKEGKAYIYDHEVFFQNGKVVKTAKERKAEQRNREHLERKAKREAVKQAKEAIKEVENEQKAEEEFADSDF